MNLKKLNKIKPAWQFKIIVGVFFIACLTMFVSNVYTQTTIDRLATPANAQTVEKQLSVKDYAWEQAKKAGLDPVEMVSIIYCESKFKSDAINVNRNGSYDLGLVQANSIHKTVSVETKLDPYKSIDWMISKRLKDKNWSAWVCAGKLGIR